MKPLVWIFFALMVLAQWAAPILQIQKHERVLEQGTVVKFKCGAPDPFDPFRGRYLVVSVEDPHADLPKGIDFKGGQTVYANVVVGADGFATFSTVAAEPPSSGLYLKCELPSYLYSGDHRVRLEVPFDRYYMNEGAAPKADAWLAKARQERDKHAWVEVKLHQGLAVVVDIKHDGISVSEGIKEPPVQSPTLGPAPAPTPVQSGKP